MILPKPIRKVIAVFRGGVSPVLIFLSVMVGFWFGLVPGWSGLHTVLVLAMLILNIHLGLFLLSAGLGKALCFAAAPVLYHAGVGVQNYLSPLLRALGSIPIIGVTDFSNYSVAGATLLGPIFGAIAGLLMARSVIGFRRQFLKLEEGSEKFKKWYSNRWVRILDRILIGKRAKHAKAMFPAKTKVIRKAGVAFALVVLAISIAAGIFAKGDTVKVYAVSTMGRANGAEVNLESLALSALTGSVSASGIQVTDPQKPQNNQLAVDKIAADASVYNLLLGRVVMENVEVSGVRFNQQRKAPGEVFQAASEEEESAFDPCDFQVDVADISKLETYFKDAKALKEKLQKLRKWLPKGKDEKQTERVPHKYLEYLEARSDTPPSPRVMAKRILLDRVEIPSELFGNSQVLLTNISDSVAAAKLPVSVELKSHDSPAVLNVTVDYSEPDRPAQVSGTFGGIDLSKVQSGLGSGAGLSFESGLASGKFTGHVTKDLIDLTIEASIENLQAKAQGTGVIGLGAQRTNQVMEVLKSLSTSIRVVGPVLDPRVSFDKLGLQEQFKTALVEAGKERLASEIDKRLGEQLGDAVPGELKDTLQKGVIKGLGGILGGGKDKKDE
jgi:uncharacterized protein (TIGR03546 family)